MNDPDPLDCKLDLNLRVHDLEASCDWYDRVFSTQPIYRGTDRSVDGQSTTLACYRLGGVKVWLMPQSSTPGDAPQRVGIALMTRQPLAPLRRQLAERGAQFDDTPTPGFPIDEDGVRVGLDAEFMYMLDPDGHRIEFCRVFRGDG
jgi:catechol 2,3-dioxygenase-like lactoylglutathione lyase family enzyme